MKVAIAQLNQVVGDLEGNVRRIARAANRAAASGADILLTPELAISGYPPEDLLLRQAFLVDCRRALDKLCSLTERLSLGMLVGVPVQTSEGLRNAAAWILNGVINRWYYKQVLPNYDVFDEHRYFSPGSEPVALHYKGYRFAVLICEDYWTDGPCSKIAELGVDAVLILNASPFHINKQNERINVARTTLSQRGLTCITANLVGGQDELVFDGLSFALDRTGKLIGQSKAFEEDLTLIDLFADRSKDTSLITDSFSEESQIWAALVLGTRDYVDKNGFHEVVLGLSGGIDSAVALTIAVDALGANRVRAVMMPSLFTAPISWIDSRQLALRLGVKYDEIEISRLFDLYRSVLAEEFTNTEVDSTEENLQARIRGTLLMALSNKHGCLVLTTSNKSEIAVGYSTLYGDMAGGFCVLKDIYKTTVYKLARYRNELNYVIPERILERPPSAELRDNQTDQDSLPPYEILDSILKRYVEDNETVEEILASGFDSTTVRKIIRLIKVNEHKRKQSPTGIRISKRGWGRDWRYPITSDWLELPG
jgi:NAD+ synthase (glutamine-hydrolysing)